MFCIIQLSVFLCLTCGFIKWYPVLLFSYTVTMRIPHRRMCRLCCCVCPIFCAPLASSRSLLGMLETQSIPHSSASNTTRSLLHVLFRTAAELIVWIMCNGIGDMWCDRMESLTQVWRTAPHNNHPLSTLHNAAHGVEDENFLTRKDSRICWDEMLNHALSLKGYKLRCHNKDFKCVNTHANTQQLYKADF